MSRIRLRTSLAAVVLTAIIAVPALAVPMPHVTQDDRACQILSPDLLFDTLGVEPADVEPDADFGGTYWSCTYVWQADATVPMEVAGRTMQVQGENRFTFSLSDTEGRDPAAVYDAGTGALMDRYSHESVDGIGDRAMWVPDIDQISVQSGGHVFHLAVEYPDGEESNLELARRLVPLILDNLE